MRTIQSDAEGGFNAFIDEQKKVPGEAVVTLVTFDDRYDLVYEAKPINDVEPFMLYPRAQTALLDAIGKTINSVGERLFKTPEDDRPEKVIVCILTDGQENSSHEFQRHQIKEMINHQRDVYKWEFVFLAANQDAFAAADSIGIVKSMTSGFTADANGTRGAYVFMAQAVSDYRSGNG